MALAHNNIWMKNLAKPEGLLGHFVGQFLAIEYIEVNLWAVHMLQVKSEDKILEVGFGPGLAAKAMAKLAPYGLIAGIDYSELMLSRAKRTNSTEIKQGLMDLRHANVSNLPDFGIHFDKIVAINNVMYWENPVEALKQLRASLKPGGLISLVLQRDEKAYLEGQRNDEISWFMQCLYQAGFVSIRHFAGPVKLKRPQYGEYNLAGISIVGFNPG